MTHRLSVLQRATGADIRFEPFPYVVLENALPDDLYNALVAALPEPGMLGVDRTQNNKRWNYRAELVEKDARLDPLWKEFIAYQSSEAFFHEIATLFYDGIARLYPKQFPTLDYMKRMRVGVRGEHSFRNKDVLMDAMIAGNTPVQTATSVRGTHIDNGRKLFSGLFYMRDPNDDSTGGDLTISRFKPAYADVAARSALFDGAYVGDEHLELVETVRYQPNCLVLFINSIDSLHGVTVRQPTAHDRRFVNLVGEVVTRLYRLTKGQPTYVRYSKPLDRGLFPPMEVLFQRLKGNRGQVLTD